MLFAGVMMQFTKYGGEDFVDTLESWVMGDKYTSCAQILILLYIFILFTYSGISRNMANTSVCE